MNQVNLGLDDDDEDDELDAMNPNTMNRPNIIKKRSPATVISSRIAQAQKVHSNEGNLLTTQVLANAKIGTMKQVIATPAKIGSATLKVQTIADKLMLRHGGNFLKL